MHLCIRDVDRLEAEETPCLAERREGAKQHDHAAREPHREEQAQPDTKIPVQGREPSSPVAHDATRHVDLLIAGSEPESEHDLRRPWNAEGNLCSVVVAAPRGVLFIEQVSNPRRDAVRLECPGGEEVYHVVAEQPR